MDINELVTVNESGATFKYTPIVVEAFLYHKISLIHDNLIQWPGMMSFNFSKETLIEPYSSYFYPEDLYSMGAFSYCAAPLPAQTRVGRYCSLAGDVRVLGQRHALEWATTSLVFTRPQKKGHIVSLIMAYQDFNKEGKNPDRYYPAFTARPVIENDVWIGQGVMLAQNITIGTGAVIAAGSVVTKNVEPYMIVGGNPAKIIRQRFDDGLVEKMLESRWWEYDVRVLTFSPKMSPN